MVIQERELSVSILGQTNLLTVPSRVTQMGVGRCLDIRELTPHSSGDSDPVGIWCFDLQRAFLHIAPFHLPAVASQATWHPCLHTRGSPTAGSFYFNPGFLHRPCSQLGLFLPAPFQIIFYPFIISSKCTKRVDRSQIIPLAGCALCLDCNYLFCLIPM